jgi:hypothetical protein
MKKPRERKVEAGQEDYDFSNGRRGKYAGRYAQGTNVVLLDADVARVFPTAKAVNSSLRALADIIHSQKPAAAR